jgi:hypothetical protein
VNQRKQKDWGYMSIGGLGFTEDWHMSEYMTTGGLGFTEDWDMSI